MLNAKFFEILDVIALGVVDLETQCCAVLLSIANEFGLSKAYKDSISVIPIFGSTFKSIITNGVKKPYYYF